MPRAARTAVSYCTLTVLRSPASRFTILIALVAVVAFALPTASSDDLRGNICTPTSDGQACEIAQCPNQGEQCTPRCVFVNAAAGTYLIQDCECRGPAACAVQLNNVPGFSGCIKPDNGDGTVDAPTVGCDIHSPDETFMIIDGLPAGTTIEIDGLWFDFSNVNEAPGGDLAGHVQTFDALFQMSMTGTGALAGFNRNLVLPFAGETHTGPRTPGDPVQSFPNQVERMDGELFGDPDFDILRFRAGDFHGLPSPGHTTLTRLPSGDFVVDSFFDVAYQIEFQGAPGSVLDGLSGTTTGTVRMRMGQPLPECIGDCPPGTTCRQTVNDTGNNTFVICCDCVACVADLDNNGVVDVFDLFILLNNWNTPGPGADLAAPDNVVDVFDLFVLLNNWGPCD